ncbi:hypothetical protein GCM10007086_18090 [Photobacterium aphoticum]|nr:hypothetical protein GCM10007086_18090 [Photobacterium aphoticum]
MCDCELRALHIPPVKDCNFWIKENVHADPVDGRKVVLRCPVALFIDAVFIARQRHGRAANGI